MAEFLSVRSLVAGDRREGLWPVRSGRFLERQAESAVHGIPTVRDALQDRTLRIECTICCRPDGLRSGKKRIATIGQAP